ncbi:MAG: hypothetical protein DME10_11035 [Candidatus Rokuibacteriota bacterium]|nr:MAG: hypothetical protein DME10_11035 [Candidatus Rokubacteria bacterium]
MRWARSRLDAESRLAQRLADRNKLRLLETRSIYFDSGKTEIRSGDMSELEDVAKALKADANAILELQGFADPRGNDRQNNELARERVEAVTRYLVQRYDIELRQLRGFAMGKQAGLGSYEAMFWTLTVTLTLAALGVMLTGMHGAHD